MKKKIVVCDDDMGILEMMEIALYDDDTEIILVQDSLRLFDVLAENEPALLLLDLWMPLISGDQILRHMRATARFASLPVIVLSASTEGRKIALDAGADAYISKPFNIAEMLDLVQQQIA